MKLKFSFIHKWYDFWIGFFIDREKRRLYFLPLPTVGIQIDTLPPNYVIKEWKQDDKPIYVCFDGDDEHAFQVYSDRDKKKVITYAWESYKRTQKALQNYDQRKEME